MAPHKVCSIPSCDKRAIIRGFCRHHSDNLRRRGDPATDPSRASPGDRMGWLQANVAFDGDACLIWPFGKWRGYPSVTVNYQHIKAHRLMCKMAHGEPPTPAHEATHSCGNGDGGCLNQKHLRWATTSENQMERVKHGTSNRGVSHGQSKLTDLNVLEIRRLSGGTTTQEELAARFGVSRTTISLIASRKRWAWLE